MTTFKVTRCLVFCIHDTDLFIFIELKEETEELSRCLSVDITILDFKEEMMLADYKRELEEQIAG